MPPEYFVVVNPVAEHWDCSIVLYLHCNNTQCHNQKQGLIERNDGQWLGH